MDTTLTAERGQLAPQPRFRHPPGTGVWTVETRTGGQEQPMPFGKKRKKKNASTNTSLLKAFF